MKVLGFFTAVLFCFSASAQTSQFQTRSDAETEQMLERMHQNENARFMERQQHIGELLAAKNNTTVTFNPNVRTSPDAIFEDAVAGEWVLGNGGVCVEGVWSQFVYCKGAVGLSVKKEKKARHAKR